MIKGRHNCSRGVIGLAVIALVTLTTAPLALAQSRSGFDYNGVVHVSWWFNEYNNFDQPTGAGTDSRVALANTRANWAAVLVTQYQNDAAANSIAPVTDKTPTDASLRFAIQELRARGIKVMLKPHVDAVNGQWRGDFNPSNVTAWFQSYTQFIVHYAQLAQEQGVEAFVMGTEFRTISGAANRDRWIAVINAVRSVYGGVLTYAANATFPADEFTAVSFWDQLDVMGLDAYFTLTNQNNPSLAQLTSAWTSNANSENLIATVQNFASSRQKPVIFTELGYKSVDGANTRPWDFGLSGAQDLSEQRDCYEAAFTVWSQRTSFMKGIFWWAWPVPAPAANDTDYNPRSKPAEAVLNSWQGPSGTGGSFTLASNPSTVPVTRGSTATSTINITRTNFTGSVTLSASGLPTGVTAAFSPASATGNSSTLTFSASGTATLGQATVTVTGTSPGQTPRTTTITLTVNPTQSFTLSANPASVSVTRGLTATSTISIVRANFTASVALTASGLPTGVTAAFNPASTTGNSSTLTFTASSTATLGQATVMVTGTSPTQPARTTTITLTVNPAQNFTLAANPASVSVARGAMATSTINITRTSFTAGVTLSASGLPTGVSAAFNPGSPTGNSSTLTLTASSTATLGAATVMVTGVGGGLTRTTTVALNVTSGTGGTGGVTVTPVVNANSQWFNEEFIRLNNTGSLTSLSVTIVIQRTPPGVSFSNLYNTIGGQIQQSNSSTTAAITYQFNLAAGQTLGTGNWTFAAQATGTGTVHPTAGDMYTVTYTSGGTSFTQTGHF